MENNPELDKTMDASPTDFPTEEPLPDSRVDPSEAAYIEVVTPEPKRGLFRFGRKSPKPKRKKEKPKSKLPKPIRYLLRAALALFAFFCAGVIVLLIADSVAHSHIRKGEYQKALDIYHVFGDEFDIALVEKYIAFDNAAAMAARGEYEQAIPLLQQLMEDAPYLYTSSYGDIREVLWGCENAILFRDAKALYETGEYQAAWDTLSEMFPVNAPEAAHTLQVQCAQKLAQSEIVSAIESGDYARAKETLQKGSFVYDLDFSFTEELWKRTETEELTSAIESGDIELIRRVIQEDSGADTSNDALQQAIRRRVLEWEESRNCPWAIELLSSSAAYELSDRSELLEQARQELLTANVQPLIDAGEYKSAIELLANGYSRYLTNHEKLLTDCARRHVRALLEAGEYDPAITLIQNDYATYLSGYDAMSDVTRQRVWDAMNAWDYDLALSILNSDEGQKIEDRSELVQRCNNAKAYDEANAAFDSGLYYTAYEKFLWLRDFWDSADRAKSCVRDKPSTGQTYRNDNYSGSSVSLTIEPVSSDSICTFFKIYKVSNGAEVHISSVFMRPGRNATVKLPAGTYIFKTATGSGNWYGAKEMFGDEGTYQKLTNSSGGNTFTLEKNYGYTLQLQSASAGNVGSEYESRSSF